MADFRTDGAIASPGSENMEPAEPIRLVGERSQRPEQFVWRNGVPKTKCGVAV